ncbi:MAG: hypothetical protein AB8B64_07285 [Granulosicoccus sp.]
MILPVFTTLSANQDNLTDAGFVRSLSDNELETARPLIAEVVDNSVTGPAGLDAPGYSTESNPDMILALLAVLFIAFLGWRFTLRHHVRQIK